MLHKRRWVAIIPGALLIAVAIAVFVAGQIGRSSTAWVWTVLLTVLGGGYLIFMFGVYVRPVAVYRYHVYYMLNGRQRETTGVFKSFAEEVSDRDGLLCHAMMVNVGDRDDPEDDRLFYFDTQKPRPAVSFGTRMTVWSNDKMVSAYRVEG